MIKIWIFYKAYTIIFIVKIDELFIVSKEHFNFISDMVHLHQSIVIRDQKVSPYRTFRQINFDKNLDIWKAYSLTFIVKIDDFFIVSQEHFNFIADMVHLHQSNVIRDQKESPYRNFRQNNFDKNSDILQSL